MDNVMQAVADLEQAKACKFDSAKGYPLTTRITEELVDHITALLKIFDSDTPLMIPLPPSDSHKIRYVAENSSTEGFSTATQYPSLRRDFRDRM